MHTSMANVVKCSFYPSLPPGRGGGGDGGGRCRCRCRAREDRKGPIPGLRRGHRPPRERTPEGEEGASRACPGGAEKKRSGPRAEPPDGPREGGR